MLIDIFKCKEMAEMACREDLNLSLIGKLKYKVHISMCERCKNYKLQMDGLRSRIKESIKNKMDSASEEDIKNLKDKIIREFKS